MKFKLLTTCVAVALLAGCGGSDDPSTSVQAYDGAIRGIAGNYLCEDGTTGPIPATDASGSASVEGNTVGLTPDTCSFNFVATPGAVDMSNGKDMSEVALAIPRGLAQAGSRVQATPFTTLVARKLEETGATTYDESTAIEVLNDLGLGQLLNEGVAISEVMTNLDQVVTRVKQSNPVLGAQLVATTHVLSDVLTTNVTNTAQISNASQNLAKKAVAANPNYPTAADGSGDVFVDVKDYDMSTVTDEVLDDDEITALEDVTVEEAQPVEVDDSDDSDDTPTGGGNTDPTGTDGTSTGGTGGTSGA